MSVVLYHRLFFYILNYYRGTPYEKLVHRTDRWFPLRWLWYGDTAVFFFFVLSGLVLYLPHYERHVLPNRAYVVRRICRIYLPYLTAVVLGLVLRTLVYRGRVAGYAEESAGLWSQPITTRSLIDHMLLVTSSDQRFDPVTWSLTYQMRFSLALT
jgi:peptidoglycan/LPS O-acetylase OafA/YrhL